ncbi:MAG: hypothetical protein F6J97_22420 [Leptolyngbya sp. SIO4C1]|nr:hypothetical protein [Leptolyngbya sp. SIO4C1]
MTEFNTLPILTGVEPNDRLACTDASDQGHLKQLPVSALLAALAQLPGNESPIVAAATAPDPAKFQLWFQLDAKGLIVGEWIPAPDRSRWVSHQIWTLGYSDLDGFQNRFQTGNPVPGDVWIESLYVSCLSTGDFKRGEQRKLEVSLFGETGIARSLVTQPVVELRKGQRLVAYEPIRVVKPMSECLYFQVRELRAGSAPKVKFCTVALTLRRAYGA